MKAAAVGLGVAMVVGAAIYGQPVQLAPKLEPVVVQPLPPLESTVPSVPLPIAKPRTVEKQPKPKPKPKVATIDPAVCAQIRQGVSWLGKEGMRQQARNRGHSEAEILRTEKQCGV